MLDILDSMCYIINTITINSMRANYAKRKQY